MLIGRIIMFMTYIVIQATYIMFSPMLASSGVPELSIDNTFTGLFVGLMVVFPSIVAALVVWRGNQNVRLKKIMLIILSIIIIVGVDIVQPLAGAYSVSGYIYNRLYENKVALVEENHPSKDKSTTLIDTAYGSYYYDSKTQDVKCVLSDRIDILDKENDTGDREVLHFFDKGEGLLIEVLQQNSSGLPLLFRVSGGDYIYSMYNSLIFQGEEDAPYVYIEPYIDLVKDGTVISISSTEDSSQGLYNEDDRLSLLFINDGEQVLKRNFDDGTQPFDISELDILMVEGEWSVTVCTYVSGLKGYYIVSNTVTWDK